MDILFHDVCLKIGFTNYQLIPSDMPIYGFNGVETRVEGTIQLPKKMGQKPREASQMLNYLVIKSNSTIYDPWTNRLTCLQGYCLNL